MCLLFLSTGHRVCCLGFKYRFQQLEFQEQFLGQFWYLNNTFCAINTVELRIAWVHLILAKICVLFYYTISLHMNVLLSYNLHSSEAPPLLGYMASDHAYQSRDALYWLRLHLLKLNQTLHTTCNAPIYIARKALTYQFPGKAWNMGWRKLQATCSLSLFL